MAKGWQSARVGQRAIWTGAAALLTLAVLVPAAAHACGGGLVTQPGGTTAVDAQRIYLAVGPTATEVVTVVRVPAAATDFGVLLPMPVVPTVDPQPVPTEEIDRLVEATNPRLLVERPSDESGCSCPGLELGAASDKAGGAPRVMIGGPITIGPVTAVVLDASSATALEGWLTENAFTVPPQHAGLIASHSGPGRAFVALRRTPATALPAGATSVGVHFTLPGDQRTLPLRFARLGAASPVSFTVFVAAPTGVATALPFETFTIEALDANVWSGVSYDAALTNAVAARANHAFVAEWRSPVADLVAQGRLGPRLLALTPPGHVLSRLSTRVPASALDSDVELSVPAPTPVNNTRAVAGLVGGRRTGGGGWRLGALGFLCLVALRLGRRARLIRLAAPAR